MSSASRGSVLSLRLSDEEQRTLRAAAEARGTSVSDLVRSLVSRELNASEPIVIPTSNSASGRRSIGQGVFWHVPQSGQESGGSNGTVVTASYTH